MPKIAINSPEQLLTVDEVADRLNVSRWTVYRHQEELGSFKVGGQLRFDPEGLGRDLEPKTRTGYESILHALEQRFGRAPIAALRTDALQRFINELAEQRATISFAAAFFSLGTLLMSVFDLAISR